ncbi:MAG TPA: hypothetical protein VH852_02745 [Hyphomicrobium sp.]|jgi:hypothetical protein
MTTKKDIGVGISAFVIGTVTFGPPVLAARPGYFGPTPQAPRAVELPAQCTVDPKVAEKIAEVWAANAWHPRQMPANHDNPQLPPKVAFGSTTSSWANQIVTAVPNLDDEVQAEPHPGWRFPRKGTIPST